MNDNRIDFVIPWVDGSDPEWQSEFVKYKCEKEAFDSSMIRYRDWDNLHYWFRAVEKFAPWVGTVHLITWGPIPSWLNKDNPKLHIVRHEDYIPKEYLPTFSSRPIELNMHRIEGLSERFVYFNDDFFLGRPVGPERFFDNFTPRDTAQLSLIAMSGIARTTFNDVVVINRRHRKRLFSNFSKFLSLRYSLHDLYKTSTLITWSTYAGFKDIHMPQPFLRSTFEQLWREEYAILDETSRHKIRSNDDVNQYLMRYEQLVTGNFKPISRADTKLDKLNEKDIEKTVKYIRAQKYAMFCINDSSTIVDFEGVKTKLNSALNDILPEKCSYEL